MNSEQATEIWQVDAHGRIFEADFAEMTRWIDEGALLRQDKVRKGNLRWIEAGKVPALVAVFNSKDNGQPTPPPNISTTRLGPSSFGGVSTQYPVNTDLGNVSASVSSPEDGEFCSVHSDAPAKYICGTCSSVFCKACPNSYGGNVKICPMCGAMCEPVSLIVNPASHIDYPDVGTFGFGDFANAIAYPLRFKASLILGAVMFALLSLGQMVVAFGGIFVMWGAIACFMLANTLTFGILANTAENFSQGKLDENFMPSFDDFSIWDDVVHPFFLMIGVYLSSFGPLIVVTLIAFFMISNSIRNDVDPIRTGVASSVAPDLSYAANAVKQSEKINEMMRRNEDIQKKRVAAMENGEVPVNDAYAAGPGVDVRGVEDDDMMAMQRQIQQARRDQLESTIGKAPETVAKERAELIKQILGYGAILLVVGGICIIWGLFYYPAACAVAGYTRSFAATLNPSVGLNTIRVLGVDYLKILVMGFILLIATGVVRGLFATLLAPFNMPAMGNIPASVLSSLFGFYVSVVFSCILGFALYKSAEKLKLCR